MVGGVEFCEFGYFGGVDVRMSQTKQFSRVARVMTWQMVGSAATANRGGLSVAPPPVQVNMSAFRGSEMPVPFMAKRSFLPPPL